MKYLCNVKIILTWIFQWFLQKFHWHYQEKKYTCSVTRGFFILFWQVSTQIEADLNTAQYTYIHEIPSKVSENHWSIPSFGRFSIVKFLRKVRFKIFAVYFHISWFSLKILRVTNGTSPENYFILSPSIMTFRNWTCNKLPVPVIAFISVR